MAGSERAGRAVAPAPSPPRSCARTRPSARPWSAPAGGLPGTEWRSPCDANGRAPPALQRAVRGLAAARRRAALPRPAPVPRAYARWQADQGTAATLGAASVVLSEPPGHQGRDHPAQVGGPRLPQDVDPAHPRSRRRSRRRGRAGPLAAPRRGSGARPGRGGQFQVCPSGRPLRLRRLRPARRGGEPGGGRRLVAHGELRARPDVQTDRGLGEALPVGPGGRARVLPHASHAGAARLGDGAGVRLPERDHLPASRALRRGAYPQDRDPLAPPGLPSARLGGRAGRDPARAMIPADAKPALHAKARLRFDQTSGGYLLLYPERGLALNATAASILKLCDGELTVDGMVEKLQGEYLDRSAEELRRDVLEFLEEMARRGLVQVPG